MLKDVWEKAIREIHPYQIGPTNQGTIHCLTNLKMLNRLNSLSSLDMDNRRPPPISKKITIEEGVALSMAAALHDIWKAHYSNPSDHHIEGSNFILTEANLLGVSSDYKSAVAGIVHCHDGCQDFNKIGDITIPSVGKVRMSEISSLFRLADVLDITFSRVSNIYKKINLPYLPQRKKDALLSREQARKIYLRHPKTAIGQDITITYATLINELKDTVLIENEKLKNITSTVTTTKGPITISDGCNAKSVLNDIGIQCNLRLYP